MSVFYETAPMLADSLMALSYVVLAIGGYLLYANVPPYKPYGAILLEEETIEDNKADLRQRQRLSRIGFGLFLLGTILQAIAWGLGRFVTR